MSVSVTLTSCSCHAFSCVPQGGLIFTCCSHDTCQHSDCVAVALMMPHKFQQEAELLSMESDKDYDLVSLSV